MLTMKISHIKAGANQETLPQKHFESMLLTVLHGWAYGKEVKHCFASETQIPRLQDMLLRYSNEKTFRKHLKSVFLQCFFSVSQVIPRLRPHATYVKADFLSWQKLLAAIFFKGNQSSDNRSHGFGAKFLLKKLSASDFSYERKSAFKDTKSASWKQKML